MSGSGLPRQRLTAGALIRDGAGRVLLVEPTYRPDWLTPGGSVEEGESPARAAAREVAEELGVALPVGRLLAMQWRPDDGGVLHLTYDGGVVDSGRVMRFRLEPGLASFRFVEPDVIADLADADTTARIAAARRALTTSGVAEL